jgi:PAS domain S-box-containing protein
MGVEITDRLLKAEPSGQEILDSLPFYVFLVNSQHRILAGNEAVRRELGLDPARILGAYCPSVVHGCESPVKNCPLAEALKSGRAAEREVFDSKSGRWLNAAVYPTNVFADNGDPIYLHFARDVTEFKKTAHELSQTLEHQWAMSNMLQKMQSCHERSEIIRVLLDQVLCLSWLGMSAKAVGFLKTDNGLEMVVQRNLDPVMIEQCHRLAVGECCCGKVAETGRVRVCVNSSDNHTKCAALSDHQHIVLPIIHEASLLGVYALYIYNLDRLDNPRLKFLESAADIAAAALAREQAREKAKLIQGMYVSQLISSQEDERKSVAQELQEHVCQSLSALLLETQVRSNEDRTINHIREQYEGQIRDLIDEVRLIAGKLRPTVLDDFGFESALSRLIKELREHAQLEIDYQFITSPIWAGRRLPGSIEVGLYRVAVDALNNVISHASASRLSVMVILQRSRLMMLIEDNGCGFDYAAVRQNIKGSMGLIAIEERVTSLGGTLDIESKPQEGTTVRISIDVDVQASQLALNKMEFSH